MEKKLGSDIERRIKTSWKSEPEAKKLSENLTGTFFPTKVFGRSINRSIYYLFQYCLPSCHLWSIVLSFVFGPDIAGKTSSG